MSEFWFTLAAGAAIGAPLAWAVGRYGATGLADRLLRWLDGLLGDDEAVGLAVDRHPANPVDGRHFRHVTVLPPEAP